MFGDARYNTDKSNDYVNVDYMLVTCSKSHGKEGSMFKRDNAAEVCMKLEQDRRFGHDGVDVYA